MYNSCAQASFLCVPNITEGCYFSHFDKKRKNAPKVNKSEPLIWRKPISTKQKKNKSKTKQNRAKQNENKQNNAIQKRKETKNKQNETNKKQKQKRKAQTHQTNPNTKQEKVKKTIATETNYTRPVTATQGRNMKINFSNVAYICILRSIYINKCIYTSSRPIPQNHTLAASQLWHPHLTRLGRWKPTSAH